MLSPSHTTHPYIRRNSISSTYDVIPEELGRGRFGIVQKCLHKHSGLEMAAKYVRLKSRKRASIRREVEVLRKVRGKSPHIVEFHDALSVEGTSSLSWNCEFIRMFPVQSMPHVIKLSGVEGFPCIRLILGNKNSFEPLHGTAGILGDY